MYVGTWRQAQEGGSVAHFWMTEARTACGRNFHPEPGSAPGIGLPWLCRTGDGERHWREVRADDQACEDWCGSCARVRGFKRAERDHVWLDSFPPH